MTNVETDWYSVGLKELSLSYPGIELDINKRRQSGMPHHEKSLKLFKKLEWLDYYANRDEFRWDASKPKSNGDTLMHLLDIIFEQEDSEAKT